jgi:hypothetical protein
MQQTTPAGWYPDPEYQGYQRYWNGRQWTNDRASIVMSPEAAAVYARVNKGLAQSKMFNVLWFGSQMVNAIVFVVFGIAVFALIVWLSRG